MNRAQEMRKLSEQAQKTMSKEEVKSVLTFISSQAALGMDTVGMILAYPEETMCALKDEGFNVEIDEFTSQHLLTSATTMAATTLTYPIREGSKYVKISW